MFTNWTDEHFTIWLAGFFDGEGCVANPQVGVDVSLAGTEREVIEAIHRRLGYGTVTEITYDRPEWRTKYHWRLRNQAQVAVFLRRLRPYLTIKGSGADRVLAKIDAYEHDILVRAERNAGFMRLVMSGLTYKQVAKRVGLSPQAIANACQGIARKSAPSAPKIDIRRLRHAHETQSVKSAGLKVRTTARVHLASPTQSLV